MLRSSATRRSSGRQARTALIGAHRKHPLSHPPYLPSGRWRKSGLCWNPAEWTPALSGWIPLPPLNQHQICSHLYGRCSTLHKNPSSSAFVPSIAILGRWQCQALNSLGYQSGIRELWFNAKESFLAAPTGWLQNEKWRMRLRWLKMFHDDRMNNTACRTINSRPNLT